MALAYFTQFFDDPSSLLLHRLVHLVQRHPLGRAHHQAVRAYRESDGAALAAFELVRHQRILHPGIAVGPGVAEIGRRNRLIQQLRWQAGFVHYYISSKLFIFHMGKNLF